MCCDSLQCCGCVSEAYLLGGGDYTIDECWHKVLDGALLIKSMHVCWELPWWLCDLFYKPLVLLSCNVNKNQLHVLELIFMIKNDQNILNSQACIFIIAPFRKCTRAILLTWLRSRPWIDSKRRSVKIWNNPLDQYINFMCGWVFLSYFFVFN